MRDLAPHSPHRRGRAAAAPVEVGRPAAAVAPREEPSAGHADRPPALDAHAGWSDEPSYVISIAARMVGLHAQTLRYYERAGLVEPARSKGNIRLYRRSDLDRVRLVHRLVSELGVNLAGVGVILRMEGRIRALEGEVDRLARRLRDAPGGGA